MPEKALIQASIFLDFLTNRHFRECFKISLRIRRGDFYLPMFYLPKKIEGTKRKNSVYFFPPILLKMFF